jgi:hypothetical protein
MSRYIANIMHLEMSKRLIIWDKESTRIELMDGGKKKHQLPIT